MRPTRIRSPCCRRWRPSTRSPLRKVPFLDRPSSMIVHSPPRHWSSACRPDTSPSQGIETLASARRPIVRLPSSRPSANSSSPPSWSRRARNGCWLRRAASRSLQLPRRQRMRGEGIVRLLRSSRGHAAPRLVLEGFGFLAGALGQRPLECSSAGGLFAQRAKEQVGHVAREAGPDDDPQHRQVFAFLRGRCRPAPATPPRAAARRRRRRCSSSPRAQGEGEHGEVAASVS